MIDGVRHRGCRMDSNDARYRYCRRGKWRVQITAASTALRPLRR
jgi:hypothetical protein